MDNSPLTQGDRLRTLIKLLKINQVKFSQALGLNYKFVSHLVNNHRRVTEGVAYRFEQAYPAINAAWLLKGTGEPMKKPDLHANPISANITLQESDISPHMTLDEVAPLLRHILARIAQIEERLSKIEEKIR